MIVGPEEAVATVLFSSLDDARLSLFRPDRWAGVNEPMLHFRRDFLQFKRSLRSR
jgi:hypothetical protein